MKKRFAMFMVGCALIGSVFGFTGCGIDVVEVKSELAIDDAMHAIDSSMDRSDGQGYYWKYIDDNTYELICTDADGVVVYRWTYHF